MALHDGACAVEPPAGPKAYGVSEVDRVSGMLEAICARSRGELGRLTPGVLDGPYDARSCGGACAHTWDGVAITHERWCWWHLDLSFRFADVVVQIGRWPLSLAPLPPSIGQRVSSEAI